MVEEDGEEAGHPKFVRHRIQFGQRGLLQVPGDPGGQGGEAGAERDAAGVVAVDEAVVLEGAEEPVGHGAVHAEAVGEFIDGEGAVGGGEKLEQADPPAQRLRCGRGPSSCRAWPSSPGAGAARAPCSIIGLPA